MLTAFEAELRAYDKAVRAMNPDEPTLLATITGREATHVLATLNSWKIQGITATGPAPRVIDDHLASMSASTAVVMACVYDASTLVYAATGKPVPTNVQGKDYEAERTTLTLLDGAWKVSANEVQNEATECPSGY